MYICLHDTFFRVKKIVKNGYCRNRVLSFAWDLGIIFLGIQIFQDLRLQKKFFKKIQILGVIEKCIGWVLVYPFLGGFLLKVQKRCVYVNMLFLVLILFKIYFLIWKKGISRLLHRVAQKHTTSCKVVLSSVGLACATRSDHNM